MSDYVKATNFTAKDALPSGNPGKIVKGTEIDIELTAIASAISSKADTNSPTFTGTPLTPTAGSSTNNTQIASTAFVQAAVAAAVAALLPAGTIVIWSGSVASIPAGWALCDGTGGRPNLRDRFVVGAGSSYAVGATGGSKDAIVVSHTHTGTTTITDPGHKHNLSIYAVGDSGGGGEFVRPGYTQTSAGMSTATTGITASTSISTTGSSGTNANLPPYYALCYIIRL